MRHEARYAHVRRSVCAALLASIAGLAVAGPASADEVILAPANLTVEDVRFDRIYMQAGTIDTSVARNDLAGYVAGLDAGDRFIVQLDGSLTNDRRDAIQAAGLEMGDYLPMNAFIVRVDKPKADALAALGFVRWYGEYSTALKISPEIGTRDVLTGELAALRDVGLNPIVVTLFAGARADAALAQLDALGASVHYTDNVGGSIEISATIRNGDELLIAGLDDVQFIEDAPQVMLRNSTTRWIVQSNQSNVTPFYDAGIRGEGQIVGVLDSRVDPNHCSFDDNVPIGPNHRKIVAYNTSLGASSHGTHVGGTVVGDGGSNNDLRGIAYEGRMVFDTIPNFTESAIVNALTLHSTQGATIHTNSWGDDSTTQYTSLCRGFDVFGYNNEFDLVVLAVTNLNSLRAPENAKNLLAVGATRDAPQQGSHCTAGIGPTSDGRRKPEIYAPGCSTVSARSNTSCGTRSLTGTSMACPAIAGAAMLVRQYYTDGYYPSGQANPEDEFTPTGTLVKATLLNSAVDMTGISGYPSNLEGWGRVLADNAAFFPGDSRTTLVTDIVTAEGLTAGQSAEQTISVESFGQPLAVTLVWMDPAAAVGTNFAAINDLDLEVVSPSGTTYRGNVFSGGQSAPGGSSDIRNNVEQVRLNNPEVGDWTIRVNATAVNSLNGRQGYALVTSGDVIEADVTCPTDWDGNGIVNAADVGAFLSDYFLDLANGTLVADFDGNGVTNAADVGAFISEYFLTLGACP